MSEENQGTNTTEAEQETTETQSGGPIGKLMPVDLNVWHQARNLITDKGIRVEELAAACVQDPVIVLELLRVANAMYFSGGRAPITSVKNAIVRLGSEVVVELLEDLKTRPQIVDPEVLKHFSLHRSRCRRVAITATILSQVAARKLSDDCQTAALFTSIGEMLAVFHYQEEYVALAEEQTRTRIIYHLANDFRFDVELMGLKYLRKNGLPEVLVFALDREAKTRNPDRAVSRPICLGAAELVDAFDTNRWEKLAPGKTLPSKSNLRLLRIDDNQYLKVYERVAEYLFAVKLAEERKKAAAEPEPEALPPEPEADSEVDELAADIELLLKTAPAVEPEENSVDLRSKSSKSSADASMSLRSTNTQRVESTASNATDQFSLEAGSAAKRVARQAAPVKIDPPKLRTTKGTAIVTAISEMFEDASSSEELLSMLLERLTREGPFEKSALIVVSKDRKNAIVVAARGPNIGNGQKIDIDDPLSPLAQCFTKVQSFGNRPNQSSPFGSKAFALAPIHADHDTPVALYADCGTEGSLTFEARRIFRTVVDILNQKLPSIPGGIPVELK